MTWLPIESAPKDRAVDLWFPKGPWGRAQRIPDCKWSESRGRWYSEDWEHDEVVRNCTATHYVIVAPPEDA
jgi:hypothetical protein